MNRYFESHIVVTEKEIVDIFANKYCHMDSDSKRAKKGEGKSREVDILRVGEQVWTNIFYM